MGLKVAMLSPWGKTTRCGIRTYTEHLVNALVQLDVDVFICRWPRFGQRTPELIESCVLDKIPRDVDLIHVQNEYGLLIPNLEGGVYAYLKRLGKPLVTTCHATGDFTKDSVIASVSDRVIVHNEWMARLFGHREKTVIIPHGCLNLVECPPAEECKKALGIDPRVPIVGYQGFISPPKGVETLVEAMTKVPNAALLVGGGWFVGEETDYIMRLKQWSLQVLKGRCMWLGYVPDERLPTVYGSMSCLVYPSRWASESGALLAALSHGKAVLASNLPPFKEKEKAGALMTFKSVADLAKKIKRLLKDEALRKSLEEGARKFAENNSWNRVAQLHKNLYETVIEKHK
jgi:glycosyltransferase involved in cell wall biosynthesis